MSTASYPGELLFIDEAQWQAWFWPVQTNVCDWWDYMWGDCEPEYGPNPNALANTGRRGRDLGLTYLPGYLMASYCRDRADGYSYVNGRVYHDIYSIDFSTVADLEANGLYSRMDQKIAATPNGCSFFISQYGN